MGRIELSTRAIAYASRSAHGVIPWRTALARLRRGRRRACCSSDLVANDAVDHFHRPVKRLRTNEPLIVAVNPSPSRRRSLQRKATYPPRAVRAKALGAGNVEPSLRLGQHGPCFGDRCG